MGIDTIIGITAIAAAVLLSIGGLLHVRSWLQSTDLTFPHDVTDPLSQVVGMLFSVLLGFMIGNSMQRFDVARSTVQHEAASLADIFNLSGSLQSPTRQNMRMLCIRYADQIVAEEWPLMGQKNISVPTIRTYRSLWNTSVTYKPVTSRQANAHQAVLAALIKMSDARRLRIESLHNGLPLPLWHVLVMGGLATILFTYFFGAQNTRLQVVMTALVSLVISLNIFLLYTFNDPFDGDVKVRPTAFETDLMMFRKMWNVNDDGEDL